MTGGDQRPVLTIEERIEYVVLRRKDLEVRLREAEIMLSLSMKQLQEIDAILGELTADNLRQNSWWFTKHDWH